MLVNISQAKQSAKTNQFFILESRNSGQLTWTLEAQLSQISYPSDDAEGEDWFIRLLPAITYKFNSKIVIKATALAEKVQGNRINIDSSIIGFSNTNTGGQVKLSFLPKPWLQFNIYGQGENRSTDDIESREDLAQSKEKLEETFSNFITNLVVEVGASYRF